MRRPYGTTRHKNESRSFCGFQLSKRWKNGYPILDSRYWMFDTRFSISSVQHPASSIQYPVSSIQYPDFNYPGVFRQPFSSACFRMRGEH